MSKELTELGQWKVGQKVLVSAGSLREKIDTITRITDGRDGTIYVGDDAFTVMGSSRGGGTWNKSFITPATEADYIRIRGLNSKYRLQKINWLAVDNAKAIEIEKLLNDNGIVTKIVKEKI